MDSSGLAAFTRPGSYWQASRAPRYSLLFALPLLVFYQVLAALQSQGGGGGPEAGLRNGADVILQSLFIALAGAWGPVLFMACLDRKSTRLNSSHGYISYAVFCLKKKKISAFNTL